jgi:sulfite dehydrogenase (quinone) subunit SoeC
LNLDPVVIVSLIGAAVVKAGYWRSIDRRGSDSTAASATGLGHLGAVRLPDPPRTETNYLMSEMGYRIARKHAVKLRRIAFATGIVVPFGLTAIAMMSTGLAPSIAATLATLSGAIGVLIERWLFFAEAKHVVTFYYGATGA